MPDESTPSETDQAERDDASATDRSAETALSEAEQAIEEARRRIAEVPAEVVVTNHVMGLYELAAIHLSASPPDLSGASLAIDAVGMLVDGLGERLGEDIQTLRNALANLRMAFVSVKSTASRDAGEASDGGGDDAPATDDDSLGPQ